VAREAVSLRLACIDHKSLGPSHAVRVERGTDLWSMQALAAEFPGCRRKIPLLLGEINV
jgi:hypothetical protein